MPRFLSPNRLDVRSRASPCGTPDVDGDPCTGRSSDHATMFDFIAKLLAGARTRSPSEDGDLARQGEAPPARGKLAATEDGLRRALAKDPNDIVACVGLGAALCEGQRHEEAEPLLRESLEKRRRVLGPDHPITLYGIFDLGDLLSTQGKLAEAEPYLREAFEKRRRVVGAANEVTVGTAAALGQVLVKLGRGSEAEGLLRAQVDALRAEVGSSRSSLSLGAVSYTHLTLPTISSV